MFPWKQLFVMHEEYGNDLPLYFNSARRIRNIQRLVSADGRISLASLIILFQSDPTAGHAHEPSEKLATYSLGEIVTTCELKREQLQHEDWKGEDGRACLSFVVDLAGLRWPKPPADQMECTKGSHLSPEKPPTVSLSQCRCQLLSGLTERVRMKTSCRHSQRLLRTTHNTRCPSWLPSRRRHLFSGRIFEYLNLVTAIRLASL